MKKLLTLCAGVLVLGMSSAFAQEKGNTTKNQKADSDNPLVMTITTISFAEATGCWTRIYDGHDFSGRSLTLVGEQSLPRMEFPNGNDWEGDIDSLAVGPKAKVTLYEDENYADKKNELKPQARVADLHKTLRSEGVESMKVTCL